jgi:BirA family biotin operon repressor/biotin-[acetyl-CoA-carboxylase] ligase
LSRAPADSASSFSSDAPVTEDSLAPLLRTHLLGRALLAFRECDSTNAVATRLLDAARTGAAPWPANGAVVVADYQRAGRTRGSGTWVAAAGSSLLFSLILYPSGWTNGPPRLRERAPSDPVFGSAPSPGTTPPDAGSEATLEVPARAHIVTMAASLAVVRALESAGASGCTIKWPNDVLDPRGRKLCGALTESVARGAGRPPALVAGVGINVAQQAADFPPELRDRASSASIVAGRPVARAALLARFLEEFEAALELSDATLFRAWERRCSTLGCMVRARIAGRTIVGHALGVEGDGCLVLRLESGVQEVLRSADVEEVRVQETGKCEERRVKSEEREVTSNQ